MENGTHGATTDGEVMHAPTSRMLSSRIEKVLKRISRMKELRRPWETMFDDCYKYAMPQRERFNSGTVANDLASDIFDSTAVISVQEFASRLQQGLVPSGTQFATLIPGSDIRDTDRKKVTDQLVEINREVYMTIRDSNFDQAVSEAFLDVAIGTAALIGDSGNSITPITFSSVPLTRLLIEGGPWGATEAMGRERKIKAKLITEVFSNALINDELAKFIQETPEKKLDICELTWRDRTEVTETWDYSVIVKKMQHEIKSERFVGVGSNPWITFRWSVAAGEDWGRGQLLNALPDIRTLNLVKELILENAEIAISGIWQTDDEGVVNGDTINIAPGTIIPIRPGSNGLVPLTSPNNFDVSQFIVEDLQNNIKRALFDDMIGPINDTVRSATEISTRKMELFRRIGSSFGRLVNELVFQVIKRTVFILRERGVIELPVIDGRIIDIAVTSPLANSQNDEEIVAIGRYLDQVNSQLGPQIALMATKSEEMAAYLAARHGVPPQLIRDVTEQKALAEKLGAAAANSGIDPAQMVAGAAQGGTPVG